MLQLKQGQQAKTISHADRQVQFEQSRALDGSIDVDSIDAETLACDVIEIGIPSFSDGRGFSVARYLRVNKRFPGVLRATGNMLPDQLQALFQVGFDEVLVGDVNLARHGEQDWLKANDLATSKEPLLPSYHEEVAVAHGSIWSRRAL